MEMPLYQSYKRVRALKIKHVTIQPPTLVCASVVARIVFEDERYDHAHVALEGKPTPHRGWYYVVYPPSDDRTEPYESFSPPEAFESGYFRIPER